MAEPVRIEFTPEGVEEIRRAFQEVAMSSRRMTRSVKRDTDDMSIAFRKVSRNLSTLGMAGYNVVRLGEAFGFLDRESARGLRTILSVVSSTSALIRMLPTITAMLHSEAAGHAAVAISAYVAAHAKAILLGLTVVGLVIVAAAIAAAAAIPRRMAEGGIVTSPTYALIGERGPEAVVPLGRFGSTVVNIYNPAFRSRSDMDYLVDRLKRMGQA